MVWVRLDDGFALHPKLLQLTRVERWTWVEILCYCARYETGGVVPNTVSRAVPAAIPKLLHRLVQVGLLEAVEDEFHVHDWAIYNGETVEKKVEKYLSRYPLASANDVQRAIGGKRELVLAIVAQIRQNGGSQPVPALVPNRFPTGSQSGSPTGSQVVHARANPSPSKELNPPIPPS